MRNVCANTDIRMKNTSRDGLYGSSNGRSVIGEMSRGHVRSSNIVQRVISRPNIDDGNKGATSISTRESMIPQQLELVSMDLQE